MRHFAALLLAGLSVLLAAASPAPPPPARVQVVVDTYFGQKVTDPYRWMETPNPELDRWMHAQNAYTRAVLAAIPGRDALRQHMDDVTGRLTEVTKMIRVLDRAFFLRKAPGDDLRKLVVRDMKTGGERVLLDPDKMLDHGHHISIDQFQPSWDGHYVAVGISPAGSEEDILHIVDATTGRMLSDSIDRARFAYPSWLPDNKSFFYNRLHAPVPNELPANRFDNALVHVHRLGADPDQDPAIFGHGIGDTASIPTQHFAVAAALPGTGAVIGIDSDGVSPSFSLYVGKIPENPGQAYHWHKLADASEGVTDFANRGDTLYLRTYKNAPRYRVISVPLNASDLSQASVVVPAGTSVLTNLAAGSDALYVVERGGARSALIRVTPDGQQAELHLPVAGTVDEPADDDAGLVADPRVPGAWVGIQTWVSATRWFEAGAGQPPVKDLGLSAADPTIADYLITETTFKARDGTELPLSIIERRGTPHDHRQPVLVEGYGAYGISSLPFARFVAVVRGWVDGGGVLAVSHIRGGGELGEDWHLGGKKATKQNTIHDFIDSAEEMIRLGYASNATLAGTGTSAGGITIGGAMTQRPDLFRAVLVRAGDTNSLRSEFTEGGPANIPEFGTVTTKDGFSDLYAMDAFQHVHPGPIYPAVLLSVGAEDHRVPPWVGGKMAAGLQAAGHEKGPVLLRVDYDGGHGTMGAGQKQANAEWSDGFAFLFWQLGASGYQALSPQRQASGK